MSLATKKSKNPIVFLKTVKNNRELIYELIKRDIASRYQGSVIGFMWSFINPIIMLSVYTFVFSVVFKARWSADSTGSKTEFALILFSGLLVYNLFSECLNKSPGLILSNVNYVKKVIFPLEILPFVVLGTAFFHMLISFVVWVIFYLIFFGIPHVTIFLFPLTLIPLMFLIIGLSLFLSALGVYLRDIGQIIILVTTVLMFMSPIFYPIQALPDNFKIIMEFNPLTFIIEQVRAVIIFGNSIQWQKWGVWTIVSMIITCFGFAWFQKTRGGFSDVL
ncbi:MULTISPECIES: ABC transporter permease [Citrobacter]|jgi:lipopolysaccharide transport system permease protein|uniref:ABC transporter permease n=1 Tax=Citrobacter TaxID=544 RepID=UPI0009475A9F|nr:MULTISPECIES: ABC transporter permease [Citrobacter]APR34022.1 sugar ABC transporter permease [Citrobacter freundii]MDM3282117.1 ABC transporter permease [Citrobacter sp. Ce104]QMA41742.1 ABC transporter permease [Citrobacter freundii]